MPVYVSAQVLPSQFYFLYQFTADIQEMQW